MGKYLQAEYEVLKKLKHRNIMRVIDYSDEFMVVDYCPVDFFDLVNNAAGLSEERCRHYFRQLMSALDYLHSQNIYHLDIKLENIRIDQNGTLKLLDFGVASSNCVSRPFGTVGYNSPEYI